MTGNLVVTLIAIVTGPHFPTGARDSMIVLLAMSMGARLAAIRYLKVPDLHDPAMLRCGLSLVAFAVGALSGALLILNVGVATALLFGLAIIVAVTLAAHLVSRTATSWSAPRPV